ncbi:hypothetical protein [Halomarina rubra]|uniref:Uncharacterized protein n=1 Tax=Halomarina rubra TaxID=2071873 RepID=A0ABD6AS73_9EURY|nr:hypothetical protein [Halomarina rubra]
MSRRYTVATSVRSSTPSTPLDAVAAHDDPRVDESRCAFVERDESADLLLVGVVHDHPASVARVRAVLQATTPDTLALELPPASVSCYRRLAAQRGHAADGETPPGGEMSAAIDASPDAAVVGIDPLDARFLHTVGHDLLAERHSTETVRSVARRTVGIARRIGRQRLAASGLGDLSTADEQAEYDDVGSTAAEHAEHEAEHVSRCSLLRSVTERPLAVGVVTTARERRMTERLRDVDGDLCVAVVGWAHLDALVERLGGTD